MKRLAMLGALAGACFAQTATFVAIVTDAARDSQVRSAGRQTPRGIGIAERLAADDFVITRTGGLTFRFCPEPSSYTVGPNSQVKIGAKAPRQVMGRLGEPMPAEPCPSALRLPRLARESYIHPGANIVRTVQARRGPAPSAETIPEALKRELEGIKTSGLQGRIERALLYEQHDLPLRALEEYKEIAKDANAAVWLRNKVLTLEETLLSAMAARQPPRGKENQFALVVGISQFQRLPAAGGLVHAGADADKFAELLRSSRGGALPPENIVLLTNAYATAAAIRYAIAAVLKNRATASDTVLLFLATHGVVEKSGRGRAYLLAHDSDPQDLAGTALAMDDLHKLIQDELGSVGRVIVYLDACHAARLDTDQSRMSNTVMDAAGGPKVFGLLASRAKEVSREGTEFGGGHGAFSYALLRALNGEAGLGAGPLRLNQVWDWVRRQVPRETRRQHPTVFGKPDESLLLAHAGIGINLALQPITSSGPVLFRTLFGVAEDPASPAAGRFRQALKEGRLRRRDPDNALCVLDEMRPTLDPDLRFLLETELRVALENRGQDVLLRYLAGDQSPQKAEAFREGAEYFREAKLLAASSPYLEAREKFCAGRALLFDKSQYDNAREALEEAIRLDPDAPYAYNALGIGYLEHGDYPLAIAAFRDASALAPYWVYPRHNLALALTEQGDYAAAIHAYQEAIRIAPQYSYPAYNLGLLYTRLNRRYEAGSAFRTAIRRALPDSGEAHNAMGSLMALSGSTSKAEQHFHEAIQRQPGLLAARHNLALLVARRRPAEGIDMWRAILREDGDFVPARLGLAEALAKHGDRKEAIAEYEEVLRRKPQYQGARRELERLRAGGN